MAIRVHFVGGESIDTIVLRAGWVRLSFEVPLGTGHDVIEMFDAGPQDVGG